MALADWLTQSNSATIYLRIFNGAPRDGPSGLLDPVPTDVPSLPGPLMGTGSLLLHAFDDHQRAQLTRARAFERGFLLGRLRTWVWVPTLPAGVLTFGLYCLADSLDLTQGSGHAFVVSCNTYLNQRRLETGVTSTGLAGLANFAGVDAPLGLWEQDALLTLELDWQSDGVSAQVVVRSGHQPDFSDLTDQVTYAGVIPGGPPLCEGLFMATDTMNGHKVYFDQTTLTPPWAY